MSEEKIGAQTAFDEFMSRLLVLKGNGARRESLVETLRLLATASSSRGQLAEFYRALLAVARQLPN